MKRFKHILYVSQNGPQQAASLERAVALAINNQAHLSVVDALPELAAGIGMKPGGPITAELTSALVSETEKQLDALIAPYRDQVSVDRRVLVGRRFLEIIKSVQQHEHDLVIKTAENPGYLDRLFGSDDMHLLRKCPCPVWLMQPNETSNYQRILAAVDFEFADYDEQEQSLNRTILELASSLALSDFAELHLVHIWDAPEAAFVHTWGEKSDRAETNMLASERMQKQNRMNTLTRDLREWIGSEAFEYLSPRVHLARGDAKQEIPIIARSLQADLVVMGTLARSGIPGLFIGNTAEEVLEQLHCSVLAVKPAGFVSPVPAD